MSLKKDILWRVGMIYFGFLVFALLIVGKIVYLQFFEGDKWKELARTTTLKNIIISSNRGNIYASDGRLLATSIPYYEIRMDLKTGSLTDRIFNRDVDSLAICLHKLFRFESPKSKDQYKHELIAARRRGERFYLISRKVNYMELQQMKQFPIFREGRFRGGFIYIQKDMRVRPHENLAARFVGYTTYDKKGNIVGIEGAYDHQLAGTEGIALKQKLPGNVWMPVNDRNEVDPKDGMDVITTIDINYQDVAEKALLRQLTAQEADHGCAVLMEVNTGKIRAIANLGRDRNGNYRELQNYAVFESVEPGSTFKLPVIIAALEDNFVDLQDSVDTGNGVLQFYDQIIRDENYWRGGNGKITVRRAFEISSNVAMVKIITKAYKGRESHFIDRLYNMRLNEKLDLEIKGEGKPYIKYPNDKLWSGVSLAMMSHGYEVKLTPLQLLTFYNAVANNGKMVKPKFVDEIRYHGRLIKSYDTEVLNHSICSKQALKKAKILLEGVVQNGTAKNLRNCSFRIAGKTGTCQLYNIKSGTYRSDHGISYQASFVGYYPAEDPKYSCIVVINAPSKNIYHGNEVAGPVFLEIANKTYSLDFSEHSLTHFKQETNVDLPYTKDGDLGDLENLTSELGIPVRIISGDGQQWISTSKKEDFIEVHAKKTIPNLVPDVVMMGAKDAVYLLEKSGLQVVVKGRGSVRTQSIAPGSRIRKGDVIILEMSML